MMLQAYYFIFAFENFEEVDNMKKLLAMLLLIAATYVAPLAIAHAAEEAKPAEPEEKPLGPGWLSLDKSVGLMDNAIGNAKGSLEKAIGINISGFLDTSWTFSTNHPSHPANISLRVFDKDQNKIEFNALNITLDKPEKDWGVGIHLSGIFGRTAELLREIICNSSSQRSLRLKSGFIEFASQIWIPRCDDVTSVLLYFCV